MCEQDREHLALSADCACKGHQLLALASDEGIHRHLRSAAVSYTASCSIHAQQYREGFTETAGFLVYGIIIEADAAED